MKKGNILQEMAGKLKFSEPTEKLLEESRRSLESKFDRLEYLKKVFLKK